MGNHSDLRRWPRPTLRAVAAWVVYLFLIMPTIIVIPMSFGDSSELVFPPREWSLDLYRSMLDPGRGWLDAAARSFQVAILTTICAVLLGVPTAYGLARAKFFGKRIIGFLSLSPIFAPTIVLALALYLYFASFGITGTITGLVISHTLLTTPFVILTTGSGMRHVDESIEDAAMVMGAGRLQIFLKVVLPLLRPSILSGALFAFLLSFDEIVVAWFVGSNFTPTLPVKMYSSIQWEISPVLAAISTVLIVLTTVVCVVAAVAQGQDERL